VYTTYYQLREKPFALSPDPRFLFLSVSHREALAHVLYGIEQGEGFIAVTGEVGTGKTTLCRTLLERLGSETEVAFIFNPTLSGDELLRAITSEFGLPEAGRTRAEISHQLNRFLLEMKRRSHRVVLVVDEAQNLSTETLEEVRLLSNLETSTSKLIQIVLFGQPELDDKLDSPELRQLRQRISVRWRLTPLSDVEASDYIRHRVRIAAGMDRDLFTPNALREIRRRARGVPRIVNLLADRSLLAGYAEGAQRVDRNHVDQAAREILSAWRRLRPRRALRFRSFKVGT
jgi:general secretion pathway protein A